MRLLRRLAVVLALSAVASSALAANASAAPIEERVFVLLRAPAPPLGGCVATSDADSATAFDTAPWQIPPGGLSLTLSTANLPVGVAAAAFTGAVNSSIATWNATDLAAFGSITTTTSDPKRFRFDGENVVGFARIGRPVGITRFIINTATGNVIEADTLLNSKYPFSTAISGDPDSGGPTAGCAGTAGGFDVQSVLTHEFGHPIGLEHVVNDQQTMEGVIGTGETRKRTLAAGDTAGANTKY